MSKCVKIYGMITDEHGLDIGLNEFMERFIRFVEENGWQAWCGYSLVDDDFSLDELLAEWRNSVDK